MSKAKLVLIAIVFGLAGTTEPRAGARSGMGAAQPVANQRPSAAGRAPADRDPATAEDGAGPPVKQKKFTPAAHTRRPIDRIKHVIVI